MPSPEAALGRGHGHRLASRAHPPRAGGQQAAELLGSDFPPGTFPSLRRGRLASWLSLRGKGGAIGSSDGEEERRRSEWGSVPAAGAPEGSGWARYEGAEQRAASEVLARGTRRPAEPPLAVSHRGETGSWSRKSCTHQGEGAAHASPHSSELLELLLHPPARSRDDSAVHVPFIKQSPGSGAAPIG